MIYDSINITPIEWSDWLGAKIMIEWESPAYAPGSCEIYLETIGL